VGFGYFIFLSRPTPHSHFDKDTWTLEQGAQDARVAGVQQKFCHKII